MMRSSFLRTFMEDLRLQDLSTILVNKWLLG